VHDELHRGASVNARPDCVLFAGPSLPEAELARWRGPGMLVLGPAGCGDVYRACRLQPKIIALVDGYFDHRLSVWHKEVLWALSQGVHVYGAASMGALRAAELAAFGMIGVGSVFEHFRDQLLEHDDEVTVVHESAERGYAPLSEAMVNLRATLRAASAAGALSEAAAAALCSDLQRLFYPERSAGALRQLARRALCDAEHERWQSWFACHGILNQKLLDALALLERISADLARGARSEPHRPQFRFSNSDCWQALRARVDRADGVDRAARAGGVTPNAPRL
jgi:hypothetical protein